MYLTKSSAKPHHHQRSQKASVYQVSKVCEELASSSNDEYLYTMSHSSNGPKIPKSFVKIDEAMVEVIVDTGTTTIILNDCNIYQCEVTELQPSTKCLFACGSDLQLTILGRFDATISFKDKHKMATINIVQGNRGFLLSYKTARDLDILDLHVNNVSDAVPVHEQLCHQYSRASVN